LYNIPVRDAACGMPNTGNNTEILESCCKVPVQTYPNKCGIYCLALGQTLDDLRQCIIKLNLGRDAFCNNTANGTAYATGSASTTLASTSTADETGTTTGTSTAKPTETSKKDGDDDDSSAAAAMVIPHLSTAGMGVLAVMVCSAVFGAL
ncbi:hypothetical protein KEM52_005668, partial [Ascosphaera acerosa]